MTEGFIPLLYAISLTVSAGLCTVVGSGIIFLGSQEHLLHEKWFLTAALAFAAGVMLHISYFEIIPESIASFEQAQWNGQIGATVCFFGGMGLTHLLSKIVRYFRRQENFPSPDASDEQPHDSTEMTEQKREDIIRSGLITALAILIHNMPEGLAMFIAALYNPGVGFLLALAIGFHNIPEGLVISIPIYHATRDKRFAFLWSALTGISEPFGAMAGYLILLATGTVENALTFAILFGLVAGMMIYVALHELIPSAHRHYPKPEFVTWCLVAGMALMAFSLMLFH